MSPEPCDHGTALGAGVSRRRRLPHLLKTTVGRCQLIAIIRTKRADNYFSGGSWGWEHPGLGDRETLHMVVRRGCRRVGLPIYCVYGSQEAQTPGCVISSLTKMVYLAMTVQRFINCMSNERIPKACLCGVPDENNGGFSFMDWTEQ